MISFRRHTLHLSLFTLAALYLSACGIVRSTTATGTTDTEKTSVSGGSIIATGMASWYGPKFHGRATANGETYNMNDLTAAHKTLPFNTVVRVENIDNGKSVVVRINDRGPYVGTRIIDLSRKSAEEIGMLDAGIANVRLILVKEGDRPLSSQNTSSRETFTVQLASFDSESEARRFASGIRDSRVESVNVSGRTAFRVYYGTYSTAREAERMQRQLQNRGYDGFVKQIEN